MPETPSEYRKAPARREAPVLVALAVCTCFAQSGVAATGSLWSARAGSQRSLFADNKARSLGDTLTVIIQEQATMSNEESSELKRDSSTSASVKNFDFLKPAANFTQTLPNLGWETKRDDDGEGKYESKTGFTTTLTCVVKEVMPNGNLLIEGKRRMRMGKQNRDVTLTGIVRPADIAADNTVLSKYVADAHIVAEGAGPVTRTTRKGWLSRVFDVIWPF